MTTSLVIFLAACGGTGLQDPTFPTGSTTMVARGDELYSVNTWDDTVVRTDRRTGATSELVVGGEPTRIARVGEELWVTLRAERSVVVLKDTGSGLAETARFEVGAEPHGIVANEAGTLVYVALSQQDAVGEYDAVTHKELRRWAVMDDPRWLALHPCDCALFVAHAYSAPLARIDLVENTVSTIRPPDTWRPDGSDDGSGEGDGEPVSLHPRSTGDLTISPSGDAVIVPTLYVDNDSPGDQPTVSGADITPPVVPYYTGSTTAVGLQLSVSKFNPALVAVPLDPKDGRVIESEPRLAIFVGGFGSLQPVRSYVSSATFDPDGTTVYATLEASDAVAAVDLRPVAHQGMNLAVHAAGTIDTGGADRVAPSEGNFYERSQTIVELAGNPSAVTILPGGEAWVHEKGGRSVSRFSQRQVKDHLATLHTGEVAVDSFSAERRLPAGTNRMDPDQDEGRRLFYSARDARMSAPGSGVSCSTCHADGRNDGLTWAFDHNPRQTPTLAARLAETQPVTWTLGVQTVSLEAQITSAGRMGGEGLSPDEAAKVAAYLEHLRVPDVELRHVRSTLVQRGDELFHSAEVGCSECHSGDAKTDRHPHEMLGLEVDTPSLLGIDATAPYFHDGSAPTLRDVVERSRDGSMGYTGDLSDDDVDALVAYLRTL